MAALLDNLPDNSILLWVICSFVSFFGGTSFLSEIFMVCYGMLSGSALTMYVEDSVVGIG